jgi:hypothetical protein
MITTRKDKPSATTLLSGAAQRNVQGQKRAAEAEENKG